MLNFIVPISDNYIQNKLQRGNNNNNNNKLSLFHALTDARAEQQK